jgi:hypothetical protein
MSHLIPQCYFGTMLSQQNCKPHGKRVCAGEREIERTDVLPNVKPAFQWDYGPPNINTHSLLTASTHSIYTLPKPQNNKGVFKSILSALFHLPAPPRVTVNFYLQ